MATKSGPSIWFVLFNTLAVLFTGGLWLIPLVIWYMFKEK